MSAPNIDLRALTTEPSRHQVQFYDSDAFLARVVADFMAAGLRAGEGGVVIATGPHREALLRELASRRVDVQRALRSGRLALLDAEEVLQELMVDGQPDWQHFLRVVGGTIRGATGGKGQSVRAFGEMVELLWCAGRRNAALRLEELWNDLAQTHDFSLLCAYTMSNFHEEGGLPDVCDRHGRILLPERTAANTGNGEEGALSDHVRELAAEIAHRREAEETLRASLADLRAAEEVARKSQEELKDFAEHALFGLQWVDAGGVILWANQAQLDMLGYQRDEYVGQRLLRFHPDEGSARDLMDRMTQEDGLKDAEARLRSRDGTFRDVLISADAFRRDGRVIYYRCFTHDVTDRKRADAERARLVAELERTIRLNTLFTAILGHDLRNPLNAIMTSIELLLRRAEAGDEKLQRPLQRALGSGKRMAAMIGQLLDLSRAREGGLPLEREPASLQVLVEEVRAEIALANPGRAIEIRGEGDVRGRWDRARISQALSNLVGNAVQHGREDAPVVVTLDGTSELAVRIDIHNRGAIPPDLLPHIFEPFRGLERKRDGAQGLGLGLYIAEQVVRAHGGEISVTSSEGSGTRFTFSLPRGGEGGSAFSSEKLQAPVAVGPSTDAPRQAPPFHLLVDSIRDYAIFMLDTQGLVRSWSQGAREVLGYEPEEIDGKHFTVFYRPQDTGGGRWERELELAQVNGHFEEEGWRVRKDGSHFWASVILTPVRNESGVLIGFAKVTRNLTERKLAQEALRQEQERFRLLVASVKDYAIFMLDPAGRVATWNAGAEGIKGYRAEEIIGQHFSRFYPPADVLAGKPDHELEVAGREGRFEDEGWRLRKDGTRFWANVVITALRDPSGRLTGFGKVTRDLTERHRLEEERLRLARGEGLQRGPAASAVIAPSDTETRRR